MPKLLQAALISAALGVSGLALAQTAPPPEKVTPPSTTPSTTPGGSASGPQWHSPQPGELRASKMIGMPVKNPAGETIGDINEIVLGKDGKVVAVVVGVGGLLGIGEREVAVRYESLQLTRDAGQKTTVVLNTTRETLKSAPEWKWSADERKNSTGTGTKPNR